MRNAFAMNVRAIVVALAVVAAAAFCAEARADSFYMSGDSTLNYRSGALNEVLSLGAESRSHSVYMQEASFDFEFEDQYEKHAMRTMIGFGTKPIDSSFADPAGWGLNADKGLFGTDTIYPILKNAFIEIATSDALAEKNGKRVCFRVGMQDLHFALKQGGGFFIDLDRAEPAMISPLAESYDGSTYMGVSKGKGAGLFRDTLEGEAGGARFSFQPSVNSYADLFYFTTVEALSDRSDEWVGGLNFDLHFGSSRQNLANAIVAVISTGSQEVYTVGIGVDIISKRWEYYAEGYLQGGESGKLGEEVVRQSAYQYRGGARYTVKKMLGFYLDASYWTVSGDNGRMEPLDPVNRDFISYEGNNTTMIMEDGVLGMDLDSNYRSAKLEFGIFGRLTSKFEDDFKMMFLYSTFLFDNPPDLGGFECDSNIGKEFDFAFMWRIHPRFVASTGYGVVWDADFFTLDDSFGVEDDNFSVWFLRFTAEF